MYRELLESCITDGVQLQKLKLSNVNLNDHDIVDNLVELLRTREMLMHLDLSWSKMNPSQLKRISEVLKDDYAYPIRTLRNLNISYNSLYFDDTKEDTLPSQEFIENLIDYINTSTCLNHIDISGMKLGRDYNPESY